LLISILYIFNYFQNSQRIITADLSIKNLVENENKITNDEISKCNNLLISNNSNQTQNLIGIDNQYKIEVSNIDNKNNDKNEDIKKDENDKKKYAMIIQSSYKSANCQYVQSFNTLTSKKSKSNNENQKENEYLNNNKEILNPLIHFTNLSSKKLKILGSSSKSKTDHTKSNY
jgi:hypothetical protein